MISSRFLDALGFVGQEQGLPRHHGPGAGRPLLLSPGNLRGEFSQNVRDAQLLRHRPDLGLHCRWVPVVERQGQTNVLLYGEGVQEIELLEYKTQTLPAEPGQVPL